MTPNADLARTTLNRIRPKKYALEGAIIGPEYSLGHLHRSDRQRT